MSKTVKEARSFLGLSEYYHRFIYATISAPITKLSTKTNNTQLNWTADDTQTKGFAKILVDRV